MVAATTVEPQKCVNNEQTSESASFIRANDVVAADDLGMFCAHVQLHPKLTSTSSPFRLKRC